MLKLNSHPAGRHFLQIPGPTNVPDAVLRAIDYPTIDHRGPEFAVLGRKVLAEIRQVFQTRQPVVIYPSSGTGAWEAALANALSPGDAVLMYETGHFASLWKKMAENLGLRPEFIAGDWASGVDAARIEARLLEDRGHAIKAVCVVHNETSTGVTSRIAEIRRAIDAVFERNREIEQRMTLRTPGAGGGHHGGAELANHLFDDLRVLGRLGGIERRQ